MMEKIIEIAGRLKTLSLYSVLKYKAINIQGRRCKNNITRTKYSLPQYNRCLLKQISESIKSVNNQTVDHVDTKPQQVTKLLQKAKTFRKSQNNH